MTLKNNPVFRVLNYIKKSLLDHKKQNRMRYAFMYEACPIKKKVILYESFFGRGTLCGPYALFLEMLKNPAFKGYKHFWAIEDEAERKRLIAEYAEFKNVHFIRYGSFQYTHLLATAGILINNVTFPSFYTKKSGQLYLNTWHGIPLKSLGYDMPNGVTEVTNVERNFIMTDYLVSANSFLTSVYENAYKLQEVYAGKFIEEGYPRLDLLFNQDRERLLNRFRARGVELEPGKKVILYAPTWRGESYAHADASVDCYYAFKKQLEERIDTSKYQLLIKVHQRVFQLAKDKLNQPFFVPATIDGNEALSISDILISDFSSIFYDYLATDKPVLFYIQDIEGYKKERGMYHSLEHLPGPYTDNIDELAGFVNNIDRVLEDYSDKYAEIKHYANADCEKNISKRIVEGVFLGKELVTKQVKNTKTKVFISRGKMLTNGISSALINLLNCVDYDKYDVTLMLAECPDDLNGGMINQVNKNIRVLYRNTTYNMTFFEEIGYKIRLHKRSGIYQKKAYAREWKRCYGDLEFDAYIDYEGYNYFYDLMMLQNKGKNLSIWLHNDMDSEREVRFKDLQKIFRLYKNFDHVVACGQYICEVNREKLGGEYIIPETLTYAKNLINYDKVQEMSEAKEAEITLVPETNQDGSRNIRFITIGRMSPEKNHMALIKAFSKFQKENPNAYLYMLGDGPEMEKTRQFIEELKLTEHVIIPGNVRNPYVILKNSDCFILPSLHEGQPVTVLEARVLKLPIILSDFLSVKGCLMENGQLIIKKDETSIYEGMKAFANGKVPMDYKFDAVSYNNEALNEFYTAVGLTKSSNK